MDNENQKSTEGNSSMRYGYDSIDRDGLPLPPSVMPAPVYNVVCEPQQIPIKARRVNLFWLFLLVPILIIASIIICIIFI